MKTAFLCLRSGLVLLTAVLAGRDSRLSGQEVQPRPTTKLAHKLLDT